MFLVSCDWISFLRVGTSVTEKNQPRCVMTNAVLPFSVCVVLLPSFSLLPRSLLLLLVPCFSPATRLSPFPHPPLLINNTSTGAKLISIAELIGIDQPFCTWSLSGFYLWCPPHQAQTGSTLMVGVGKYEALLVSEPDLLQVFPQMASRKQSWCVRLLSATRLAELLSQGIACCICSSVASSCKEYLDKVWECRTCSW